MRVGTLCTSDWTAGHPRQPTNYIPSGFGPAESSFETITQTIPGGLGTTSISYSYDALYRLTNAVYTGTITATFAYDYDPVGNMTAFTETVEAQNTSVTRSFDAANRLQTSFDVTAGTTSYIYDSNGNLTEVYPPGSDAQNPVGALSYGYDQRNMLLSHCTKCSNVHYGPQTSSAWLDSGKINRELYPVFIRWRSINVVCLTTVMGLGSTTSYFCILSLNFHW